MAELCGLLDIKKTRTTAYHPQSDGMVERFNQTFEAQLSKFADHSQRDWDQHIPFLLMAYQSAMQDTTGNTPARIMLGRESPVTCGPMPWSTRRRADWVHKWLCYHSARKIGKNPLLCSKAPKPHDRPYEAEIWYMSLRCLQLKPGDAVWFHNPQHNIFFFLVGGHAVAGSRQEIISLWNDNESGLGAI